MFFRVGTGVSVFNLSQKNVGVIGLDSNINMLGDFTAGLHLYQFQEAPSFWLSEKLKQSSSFKEYTRSLTSVFFFCSSSLNISGRLSISDSRYPGEISVYIEAASGPSITLSQFY